MKRIRLDYIDNIINEVLFFADILSFDGRKSFFRLVCLEKAGSLYCTNSLIGGSEVSRRCDSDSEVATRSRLIWV